MGWWEDLWGRDKGTEQTTSYNYEQMPEFAEATGAREDVYGRLKGGPDYDEISTNWKDIQDLATKKINQHYWGSALTPGLAGKLKARSAGANMSGQPGGNMSGQPAEMRTLAKMGAEEASQLSELAVKMATGEQQEKQKFTQDWYSNMFRMMAQKPTMKQTGTTSNTKELGGGEGWNMLADLGGAAMSFLNPASGAAEVAGGGTDWLSGLFSGSQGVDMGITNNATQAYIADKISPFGQASVFGE